MNYFEHESADPRDKNLKLAIKLGAVPEGCLQHGALVLGIHELGDDPCAECTGPRDRCGGRPMLEKKEHEATNTEAYGVGPADDATFRRMNRMRTIQQLRELCDEKK